MKDDDPIYEMNYQDGTKKNSVKILISDFNRLEPSVYLNDTLILFFLKFLQNFVLTVEQNQRVHIFNSYFMELITNKVNAGGLLMQYNQTTSSGAAQKYDIQFNKMKRWTRSIDLFNGNI
jgi:Ulp1 family protease